MILFLLGIVQLELGLKLNSADHRLHIYLHRPLFISISVQFGTANKPRICPLTATCGVF